MEIDEISKDYLKRSECEHTINFVDVDEAEEEIRMNYVHLIATVLVTNKMKHDNDNEMWRSEYNNEIGNMVFFLQHSTFWPRQIVDLPTNAFMEKPNEPLKALSLDHYARILSYVSNFEVYANDTSDNFINSITLTCKNGPIKNFTVKRTEQWASVMDRGRIFNDHLGGIYYEP